VLADQQVPPSAEAVAIVLNQPFNRK
jgi:hypothetical protein